MSNAPHYGFQHHLSPRFPSQLVVDVTERCNLACHHCPHEELTDQGALGEVYLDPDLHRKAIDEVATDGRGICRYLRYTAQGEPLLHPRIFEMLEYAAGHSGTAVNLTTNGTVLGATRARRLLDGGVDVIDVSIDALRDETYAKVRKKGKLAKTRSNIRRLIELKAKGGYATRVVVSFVEQEENRGEAEGFEHYWREAGADFVVIRRLHTAAGAKRIAAATGPDRYPCLYPWERLTLSPGGMLHFCPQDWVRGSEIADFRHTGIQEAWRGEAMRALREAHLAGDFNRHPFCGQCPDWAATRWPGQGESYADLMARIAGDGE